MEFGVLLYACSFLTVYAARPQKTKFHVPNLIFDPLLDENVGKYVLQFH